MYVHFLSGFLSQFFVYMCLIVRCLVCVLYDVLVGVLYVHGESGYFDLFDLWIWVSCISGVVVFVY